MKGRRRRQEDEDLPLEAGSVLLEVDKEVLMSNGGDIEVPVANGKSAIPSGNTDYPGI